MKYVLKLRFNIKIFFFSSCIVKLDKQVIFRGLHLKEFVKQQKFLFLSFSSDIPPLRNNLHYNTIYILHYVGYDGSPKMTFNMNHTENCFHIHPFCIIPLQ